MKLADIETPIKPLRVVVLPPSVFADDWQGKPREEVAIGLRLLSQSDVDTGRREAEREASGFYAEVRGTPLPPGPEAAVDVYNDALVMFACARGTCDPNDVTKPYFAAADDMVRIALTADGARRVYDELVLLHKTQSAGRRRANREEEQYVAKALRQGIFRDDESLKLVAYLADKLADAGYVDMPDVDEDESDADADAEGEIAHYVARAAEPL